MGWFNHYLVILPSLAQIQRSPVEGTVVYLQLFTTDFIHPRKLFGISEPSTVCQDCFNISAERKSDISQPSPRFNQKHPKTQGLGYVIPLNIIKKTGRLPSFQSPKPQKSKAGRFHHCGYDSRHCRVLDSVTSHLGGGYSTRYSPAKTTECLMKINGLEDVWILLK